MQSVNWYFRRLRTMGGAELLWRLRSALRDKSDRYLIGLGWQPGSGRAPGIPNPPFRLADVVPGSWKSQQATADEARWVERLVTQARPILDHRLSFLGLDDVNLGSPPDWHREHALGIATPRHFSAAIDYRDRQVTGDCKLVWEPNRHHHLVVLARAYRATGERRYAEAAVRHLLSWIDANPFGFGMNWRSPLELAIRVINWTWAIDLIREADALSVPAWNKVLEAAYLHIWDIHRKFSQGSSANNHLIGEAAGVFIASLYFDDIPAAPIWRESSRQILEREILRQTYSDGCNREQALGYHLFVSQFLLTAAVTARSAGCDLSPSYWHALERMFAYLASLAEGGDSLPMYGDADDGYVLDLGDSADHARSWLAVASVLFNRGDFKQLVGEHYEPVRWLLGTPGWKSFNLLSKPTDTALKSHAFREAGYYIIQSGHVEAPDRISLFIDCGELGYQSIAAHGHADALSFTLRVSGDDVFVDPGTYDYFTFPQWRQYFRSTRAHNTATVDHRDQSHMLGAFMWGRRANSRCEAWTASPDGARFVGSHDGYDQLADPVVHRRTIDFDAASRKVSIEDHFSGSGAHTYELWFHLAEACVVMPVQEGVFILETTRARVRFTLDRALTPVIYRGSEDPLAGWVSRGYHRKTPTTTIVGRASGIGTVGFLCELRIEVPL
uniref:Heparinase n=1 Tax=uncultured bacterium lac193 TaxID=1447243 RepID=X2LBU4_9BACT|nr:heparinase [uncultured bacterium lac193]